MKRRLLSVLVCICLLWGHMGLSVTAEDENELPVLEDPVASSPAVLQELDFNVNGMKTINEEGYIFGQSANFSPALNFTEMGYSRLGSENRLALQADVYISTSNAGILDHITGQIEFTSSGGADDGEMSRDPKHLGFVNNDWHRATIPLSDFGVDQYTNDSQKTQLDPTAVDFFRIYIHLDFSREYRETEEFKRNYAGQRVMVKITNVKLVDTDPSLPADASPVGDGTRMPEPPNWRAVTVGAGYNNDDIVVAGYNLGDYLQPNTRKDATPYIQSLLDGLDNAGGGTLFIPAGEYVCRGHLTIPPCVTIYGEWKQPGSGPVGGTVLKVYADKGDPEGTPFIRLNTTCMLSNLTFWYPEQNYTAPVAYPPTILGGSHYQIKNVTFVNSYYILQQGPAMSGCPNLTNVYGTPLHQGMDMDGVADIGRLDGIHLSPDYWIGSGLVGSPSTQSEQETLRAYMRRNVTGITLRRIDWSYLCFSEFKGLETGLKMEISYCDGVFMRDNQFVRDEAGNLVRQDNGFPNGQNYGLTFDGCETAIYVVGVSGMGEMVTSSVIRNCTNGVVLGNHPEGEGGVINFSDMDISATDHALLQQGMTRVMMLSSRIHSGSLEATNGTLTLTNNAFETPSPQLELSGGACGAVLVGNTAAGGFTFTNDENCIVAYDETPADVETIPRFTPAAGTVVQVKQPARREVNIAAGLDNTGATDVTAALNALLYNMGNAGGGVVFLPDGVYRLDGSITVPEGVELKGVCDMGRSNPYRGGTIFAVYGGKGNANGTPTVILEQNAGIRGVTFDYPEQSCTSTDKPFEEYPFAIQGRGSGVYVINVAIRNGWNGLDLMTYRCDGHYVEYLSGTCLNTSIQVGNGAENGYICNYQFNYGAMIHGAEANYGAWSHSPAGDDRRPFEIKMKQQVQNNAPILVMGDVTNEVCVNNFNYSGRYGVQFVEEGGESANALFYGHGCDYTVVPVMAEHTENVTFVNLQTTSFNYDEISFNRDMYEVELGAGHTGRVNIYNMSTWAPPKAAFHVMNGVLNVYGADIATDGESVAEIEENGRMDLTASIFTRGGAGLVFAGKNPGNLYINGGFRVGNYTDMERLGRCDNLLRYVANWSASGYGMPGTFTSNGATLNDTSGGEVAVKNGEAVWRFKREDEFSQNGWQHWFGIADAAGVLEGSTSVTYEYEILFDTDDGNDRVFISYGDTEKWHSEEGGAHQLVVAENRYSGNGFAVHGDWGKKSDGTSISSQDKNKWIKISLTNERFTSAQLDGHGCITALGNWVSHGEIYVRSIRVYDTNTPSKCISVQFNTVSQVCGNSLTLEGEIGVNYYLRVPQEVEEDPNAYVMVNSQKVLLSELKNDAGRYGPVVGQIRELDRNEPEVFKVTGFVAAKQMHRDVSLALYDGDGKVVPIYDKEGQYVESVHYTAQDYLNYSNGNNSGDLLDLTRAMSDYGRYAQIYFDYDTDRLEEPINPALAGVAVPDDYRYQKTDTSVEGITLNGATLLLESKTSLRLYFDYNPNVNAFAFTVDDVAQTPKWGAYGYYLEVSNIAAKDLGRPHIFTFSNGSESMSISYSPMTYCWVTLSRDNDESLKNLVRALYRYSVTADAYFRNRTAS